MTRRALRNEMHIEPADTGATVRMIPRPRGDGGQAGGWEVIPFGILIFVIGSLFLVNVWAIVDARMIVGDAAREGARAFVHADTEAAGRREADDAARATVAGRGQSDRQLTVDPVDIEPGFQRCAQVTVVVHETVPAIVLPFLGGFGHGVTVSGTQREIIDPFRADLPAASSCHD